jgi:outer membrane murein-binding lipoprotein Lpp
MALPRQVEAQLKELEEIEKQLAAQQNPQDPPAEPEPQQAQPAEPTQNPEPVAQQPEVKSEKPVEPEVPEETWQQKYKTLKGMYDAEVPRLHSDVRELRSQMDRLQKAAETPKPESKPAKMEKLVTDADVQAFGEDLIEVQRKVAREVAAEFRGELDAMRVENEKLREQLTTTGTQVSEASFEQRLYRLVPDFQAVNADDRWIGWLNEVDPLLRAPRKSVAQDAFNRGDAEAVAHYIGMFKSSVAPAEQPSDRAAELEKQIQPKRSAATAPVSQQAKTYTDAQIQKMFQKSVELSSRGQREEATKLEAEIDAAYRDGRVRA